MSGMFPVVCQRYSNRRINGPLAVEQNKGKSIEEYQWMEILNDIFEKQAL